MHTLFIIFHLAGASVLGITIFASFFSIYKNYSSLYTKLLYILSGGLIAQVLSGSILELTASQHMFLTFCSKIVLYLGIVFITQVALLTKMHALRSKLSFNVMKYSFPITIISMIVTGLLLKL